MTLQELDHLTDEEIDLLLRTPALVSVLIAGADKNIDRQEIMHAVKAVQFRALLEGNFLNRYYDAIKDHFEGECFHIIQKFEHSHDEREAYIIEQLKGLNDILPKLEKRYAGDLLKNWRSLAVSVANSSGGFLGFERVSLEESHFVDLKMITYTP